MVRIKHSSSRVKSIADTECKLELDGFAVRAIHHRPEVTVLFACHGKRAIFMNILWFFCGKYGAQKGSECANLIMTPDAWRTENTRHQVSVQ